MGNDPGQLAAQLTLALVLLLVAGLLLTRMLRTIPGAGWVALPFPGQGLLRRTLTLLVLLLLIGCCWTPSAGGGCRCLWSTPSRPRPSPTTSAPPRPPASPGS